LGTDVSSDRKVILLEVDRETAERLERAKKVDHMFLAHLLEVIEMGDRRLAVMECIQGETLAERLKVVGKKPPVDAVRSALRIADALSALHDAGTAHGMLHAAGIIVEPEDRSGPIVTFSPRPSAAAQGYVSPERKSGDGPSESDDSWATAALLHTMLLGEPPPATGYVKPDELATAGVADQALREALFHALSSDTETRSHDLRPFKRELARWFVEHAGEEPLPPGFHAVHSSHPPPLPSDARISISPTSVRPSRRPPPPAKMSQSRVIWMAVAGITLGIVGAWLFNATRKPRTQIIPIEARKTEAPVEEAKAIDLGEVPVTGESAALSGNKLASCAAGYLPKGTFVKSPELGFICDEADPRTGADKLRSAIVAAGPKGAPSEAMKIFSRLGWYDMAAYAVVRAACCENSKSVTLPNPSAKCSRMDEALNDVGAAVGSMRSPDDALKKYTEAVHCEVSAGRGAEFRRAQRPAAGEDTAFLELVKTAQQ
jgi:serine/threonine protein kinase